MNADLEPPDAKAGSQAKPRPPNVETQIIALRALTRDQLLDRLRQAARGPDLLPEVLLHIVRHGYDVDDPGLMWAAYAALVKVATPMLAKRMYRLYRMNHHDLQDHQSMVFGNLVERVHRKDSKLDFAERRFAKFLMRRSIDAMRKSSHPWAMTVKPALAKLKKAKPTLEEESRKPWGDAQVVYNSNGKLVKQPTPSSQIDSTLDPQARAEGEDELEALRRRLDHLPEKWCRAYFESQVMQRTHPQIAEQLRASERSIRTWIKAVAKAVGQRNEHD